MREVLTRKQAKELNLARYFTGNPCPKGHIDERRTRNSECLACIKIADAVRSKKRRTERPEIVAEYKRRDYQKNKESHRKRNKKWADNNPDKVKSMRKRWRLANKERFNAMVQDWRRRNPAAHRQQKYRRRMLEVLAEGSFTEDDLIIMLEQQNGLCLGPNCDIEIVDTFTVDHKVPLSRGGNNDPDNLQLLCRSCNSAKGTQTDDEWRNTDPTGL